MKNKEKKKPDERGHIPRPVANARKFDMCLQCPEVRIRGFDWEKPCPKAVLTIQAPPQPAPRSQA